jgi:hypothetical protein
MSILRALTAVLAVIGVAACETAAITPAGSDVPAYTFTTKLDVANISTVQAFDTSTWRPAERMFADRLVSAVGAWSNSRLKAVGSAGAAKVIVQNASVGEQVQRQQTGPTSMAPVTVYDGVLEVKVEAADRRSGRVGTAEATVRRQQSVPGTVTPEQRDQIWSDMARDMLNELDTKLPPQVKTRLGYLVVP